VEILYTCLSVVRAVNGTAFGCLDYVHSICEEVGDEVIVTKRFLSDLDSRGLNCEADASTLRVETTTYPRCSSATGVAMSCVTMATL
jgi:hypothetical protein